MGRGVAVALLVFIVLASFLHSVSDGTVLSTNQLTKNISSNVEIARDLYTLDFPYSYFRGSPTAISCHYYGLNDRQYLNSVGLVEYSLVRSQLNRKSSHPQIREQCKLIQQVSLRPAVETTSMRLSNICTVNSTEANAGGERTEGQSWWRFSNFL